MEFRAIEYGVDTANIFSDSTPFPGYLPTPIQHPLMKGLVYIDKHTQPSSDACMAEILQARYGSIDASSAIELVSRLQTGDIHLAVYDFVANTMYASVASMVSGMGSVSDNMKKGRNRASFLLFRTSFVISSVYSFIRMCIHLLTYAMHEITNFLLVPLSQFRPLQSSTRTTICSLNST